MIRFAAAHACLVTLLLSPGGCGGGDDAARAVGTREVERSVEAIIKACVGTSFDPNGSTVSLNVSRLLRWFREDPDAIRGDLEHVSATLNDCKPMEAQRVEEALGKQ